MKILDLGCGRGGSTANLKKEYGEDSKIYGIDIEKRNIEIAENNFGNKCEFILSKEGEIPFKGNFFNKVYSIEVLEHVENLEKTLKEVARVLKKKEKFIATFPNVESEKKLVKLNKNYLSEIGHRRIIDISDFKKIAERYFVINKIKIYNSIEHLYWQRLFKKGYKITSENGDLNKPAPRAITFLENIFNPDKKDFGKKTIHKIVKILNKIFSKISFLFDLFFTKKRVKIILEKK